MRLFAVTAKPVLHSLSPALHNHAFMTCGIDAAYTRLAADTGKEALALMKAIGIAGMNVSAPFKEEMAAIVDVPDERSELLGAVNTVVEKDGKTYGYNTDVDGVSGALGSEYDPGGSEVLILGTGGAARAAALAVKTCGAIPIVAGRTAAKLAYFNRQSIPTVPLEEARSVLERVPVLISTIPASAEIFEQLRPQKRHIVLEALYGRKTPLGEKSARTGARYVDGKSWLLHQAAAAFEYFTGVAVDHRIFSDGLERYQRVSRPIYFIGLMGAGKTSVGRSTAAALETSFRDIDQAVEAGAGMPVSEIFSKHGETEFRSMELQEVARAAEDGVGCISCGGGLAATDRGCEHVSRTGVGIWLWAEPAELAARVEPGAASRPLLAKGSLVETLANLLSARKEMYARASSLIVSTSGRSIEQITEKISYEYRSTFGH